MFYETYGEFEVPREAVKGKKSLNLSKEALNNFWKMVDQKRPGLSGACGCYIFAIKAGQGRTPWYVGQSKGPFKDECFAFHKREVYRTVTDRRQGTPVLILVARVTPKGKLAKKLQEREANFVEQLLISHALSKNSDLSNTKNTSFIKKLRIPGVLNSLKKRPKEETRILRSVLGIRSSQSKN